MNFEKWFSKSENSKVNFEKWNLKSEFCKVNFENHILKSEFLKVKFKKWIEGQANKAWFASTKEIHTQNTLR